MQLKRFEDASSCSDAQYHTFLSPFVNKPYSFNLALMRLSVRPLNTSSGKRLRFSAVAIGLQLDKFNL